MPTAKQQVEAAHPQQVPAACTLAGESFALLLSIKVEHSGAL